MSIPHCSTDEFRAVIAENLTPSEEVKTPERLFGRDKNLTAIDRALNSPGRQIFIYGDRGVGKTSLARTAAYIHTGSSGEPIYVPCGRTSTFAGVVQAIGHQTISIKDRMERRASGRGANVNVPLFGGVGFSGGTPGSVNIPAPQTIDEALDVVRYVAHKRGDRLVVVIDEMERIETTTERDKFAEFIKNIPTLGNHVRFIFCGIASDVNELLNSHPSAGRILEAIPLARLHHNHLWQIITTVAEKLHVTIDRDMLVRIGQISDGFPHFVHLIGDTMFWAMYDDPQPVKAAARQHFRAGIKGALERSEGVLRVQYETATQKTKNTEDYEEALWAMADTTSDRRQLQEIYESSYVRIMLKRAQRKALPKERFNQRLLALRKESHGRIIVGHGSGWFSFRENIMRGYVRLRAEQKHISLGRDTPTEPTE
jgi:Cdc6-like AAA superfamily ATPase